MTKQPRSSEMTALLTALLTAQWFSSTTAGYLDACGNAVWLSMLVGGLALTVLSLLTYALVPKCGLLPACADMGFLSPVFLLLAASAFLLLAAAALRDTLTMLSAFLLPETSRPLFLLLLLPPLTGIVLMGFPAISRGIRFLAPALLVLYGLVLVLSVWKQANLYNLTPLLGAGAPALLRTALRSLSVSAWLPLLWIFPTDARPARKAPLMAMGLAILGYFFCALLFPNGSLTETSFPLHRLSASGGFSQTFQRAHALFVFVWLPIQITAVSAGLMASLKAVGTLFPRVKQPNYFLLLLLPALVALAYPTTDDSPAWLHTLLQTSTQAMLLCPLLLPLIVGKLKQKHREKEARHA